MTEQSRSPEHEAALDDDSSATTAWARAVVLLLLAIGVGYLLWHTSGYSQNARRLPMLSLSVAGFLIALQFAVLIAKVRSDYRPAGDRARLLREMLVFGWVIALGTKILLLGLMVGSMAFLAAYLLVHRRIAFIYVVLVVVGTGIGVHLIFVEVLNLRLPSGLLLR